MTCHRQRLVAVILLIIVPCLMIQPASAGSGFWDEEFKNASGASRYRTSYNVPDIIPTNSSQVMEVTFKVLQLGGTTYAVKTQSIEMQIEAKGATRKIPIASEVRELKANDTWGPIRFRFTLLDKDFNLSPQEAVTAQITITINFNEIWSGGEWGHTTTKTGINAELRSSTVPTTIDYLGTIIALVGPYLLPLEIALVVVVFVSVTVVIYIGPRRGRRSLESLF